MEGIPLALDAERPLMLELLVIGNLECTVHNNFPLPENGIIGIPFIHSYVFNLTKTTLKLDEITHTLHHNEIYIPKRTMKLVTLECDKINGHVHYRSELWDHLFFDDCLNYLNFNSVSEKSCTLNNVKAIKIIFKISLE